MTNTPESARDEEWQRDADYERATSRPSRLRYDDGHPSECGPNCLQCAEEADGTRRQVRGEEE